MENCGTGIHTAGVLGSGVAPAVALEVVTLGTTEAGAAPPKADIPTPTVNVTGGS